jgi:hypothetical protein
VEEEDEDRRDLVVEVRVLVGVMRHALPFRAGVFRLHDVAVEVMDVAADGVPQFLLAYDDEVPRLHVEPGRCPAPGFEHLLHDVVRQRVRPETAYRAAVLEKIEQRFVVHDVPSRLKSPLQYSAGESGSPSGWSYGCEPVIMGTLSRKQR